MANKKLKKSLKKYDKSKQNKETLISGELGITLGGRRIVEVPGRQGFVYVRLKGNTSELIQAYNATVSPVYDLPVFVVRQTGIYKVVGRNIERHQNQWGTAPFLPKHGGQHSFNHEIGAGGDVVWTYSQQFMPLLSYPSGTQGSMTLSLSPAFYEWEGSFRYAQITGSPDYTPLLPTITGSARMVLSYLDPSDNSIKLVPGTPFSNSITGAAQIAQYIPDIPRSIGLPLAAVRLVTGTTQINWNAIYDVRDFFTVHVSSGTSGGGGGGGLDTIGFAGLDEGIPLGTGTSLNVVGAGASFSRSGTMFRLEIPGGGGAEQIGIMGWNEGTPLGTGTVLNVEGNLGLSISGTVLNLSAPVTTYFRVGQPTQIAGAVYQVPDRVYASGSLGVFNNGLALTVGVDYEELIWTSGTYQYLRSATGTHLVHYGVPCTAQTWSQTGTGISGFALQDSDSELLQDSDGIQLLDSDG
jgi:hypothetical protein